MKKIIGIIGLAAWLLGACAPTHYVQPLEKGEHVMGAHFGGPVIENIGPPIPMPLTSVNYGYGLAEEVTVFGSLHTTALAFGTAQVELGGLYNILDRDTARLWMPGISTSAVANMAVSLSAGEPRLWPQLDANAYWQLGKSGYTYYLGMSNWFELQSTGPHETVIDQRHFGHLQTGWIWQKQDWNLQFEAKWLSPGIQNSKVVVDYLRMPGDRGALGLFFTAWKTLNFGNE